MSSIGIIATIGPVSINEDTLIALKGAGMTVARLNGSHGSLDWHREAIKLIREVVPDIPILLDIPGRKIRTNQLAHEPSFDAGDVIILTTDSNHDGTEKVPVNFDALHEQLKPGARLFADDGTLSFTVERIDGRDIYVRAFGAGVLRSRKGINVPDVMLGRELVTANDRKMLAFAQKNEVDYLGISFVESAEHVAAVRSLIGGRAPRIVAKIENQGGMDNLDSIVGAADVIMIDRGDLSVETDIDHVSVFQKRIIASANALGKPVIVATELLHSMIENAYPTKAEIGDITNAVIDGASLLMLSGETAVGRHPVNAVSRLSSIAAVAINYMNGSVRRVSHNEIARAVNALTETLPVDKIVVLSRSGYAAGLVASAHVKQDVIAVHDDPWVTRTLNLLPGVAGVHLPLLDWQKPESVIDRLRCHGSLNLLRPEDIVLIVSANQGDDRQYFNSFQTVRVGHFSQSYAV